MYNFALLDSMLIILPPVNPEELVESLIYKVLIPDTVIGPANVSVVLMIVLFFTFNLVDASV
jgi:hypothetical protein